MTTTKAMAERRLLLGSPGYPRQLARAPDPPPVLHLQGNADLLSRTAVAVVGARKATQLGRAMARTLGIELAKKGVVVVSGCAMGIDAQAHIGALEAGGPTVAVLGGGLDISAPASNRELASRIAREGCLISEYGPGVAPRRHHFPARNRIIAGLSRIVVVVDAAARSGALITARLALAAGRDVMAVPAHPLIETSAGANGLIGDGARPVFSADDVLEELESLPPMEGVMPLPRDPVAEDTGSEGPPVLAVLSESPSTPEEIAARLGADLPSVLGDLVQLEILGLARALPGSRYVVGAQCGAEEASS